MIVFCVTLLLLHQAYTLVPVTTVRLGEPANFTCVLPDEELSSDKLHWYKQSAGGNLKLIVTYRKLAQAVYGPGYSASTIYLNVIGNRAILTILRTIQEDEGMYHCAVLDWNKNSWSGTYLSLKGNTQRTSNLTVVQWKTVSDPDRPGDLTTLQCSVLSDSKTKTCPGNQSVFWFRAGSDKSNPEIIYTDRNRHDECDQRSDTQKGCIYRFSMNVNSSDAGNYYCALATCGEIIFGKRMEIEQTASFEFIVLVIAIVCLVISVIGNIVFICYRKPRPISEQFKGIERVASQARHDNSSHPVDDIPEGGDLNYAALHFSGGKATRGRKKKELKTEECVYSQVTR